MISFANHWSVISDSPLSTSIALTTNILVCCTTLPLVNEGKDEEEEEEEEEEEDEEEEEEEEDEEEEEEEAEEEGEDEGVDRT